MTRRLFLHIGMMKSGTTYLQAVCNHNADALERSGVRWVLGNYTRQAAAVNEFRDSVRLMPGLEGSWPALQEEVRSHDGDALVSFELIADLGEREVKRFVDALPAEEVHVIVTARDLSRVLPSLWQESTQNRSTTRWPEYLDAACDETVDPKLKHNIDLHTDYAAVLRRWAEVVPTERLHLVTVPPSSAGPEVLWHRFASVIGAEQDLARPTRSNQTIGAVSSELMIRLNERVTDLRWPVYRLGFKDGLSKRGLSARAGDEPKMSFPADRWEWVEERTRTMIEQVREVGPRITGDLDDLLPQPSSTGQPTDWRPSDAELLEAALAGLESLGRQLGNTRLQEWRSTHGVSDQAGPRRALAALAPRVRRAARAARARLRR